MDATRAIGKFGGCLTSRHGWSQASEGGISHDTSGSVPFAARLKNVYCEKKWSLCRLCIRFQLKDTQRERLHSPYATHEEVRIDAVVVRDRVGVHVEL